MTTNHQPTYQGASICLPPEKFPESQMSHNYRNYLQLAKPHLCQSVKQLIVSSYKEAPYSYTWD